MNNLTLANILELDLSERIQLVEDIWDSIAAVPNAVPLTEVQKKELDDRLSAYRANPQSGLRWDEVKKRINRSR